ncbi:MAG: adenylosuccinate lyase, partial [Planctomycetes bacterium]|nr:adenylosuccinate lyase [Planctomycetota bacterium]
MARRTSPTGRRAKHDSYENPLVSRYASDEMIRLWSPQTKFSTWRRIWIALAESQRELGLRISVKQIRDMKRVVEQIDFKAAAKYERQFRHDVMAHIHAFADAAPSARGIIHLGATSMDVVDNCDLLLMRAALDLVFRRLIAAIRPLADFCEQYADMPALGFTHLQPAQLTTVGKRGALWLQDLVGDALRIAELRDGLKCRGLRGATGTQASFLGLLGSSAKVKRLEAAFAKRLGFDSCYALCGQTYSRKTDIEIVTALANFAAGAHKTCNDVRLLAMLKELEEPFGKKQVGSSAMAYKRNPMKAERATGLARYLISLASSPFMTAAAQMFERTLDDSANKRLVMPEGFLCADAIALLLASIFDRPAVYPRVIADRVRAELPFIASEDILMAAAARGGDRQALHERIRGHSMAAAEQVKGEGRENDLIDRLQADPAFAGVSWDNVLDPTRYVGLAPQQTR